jgi:hypothetical protein
MNSSKKHHCVFSPVGHPLLFGCFCRDCIVNIVCRAARRGRGGRSASRFARRGRRAGVAVEVDVLPVADAVLLVVLRVVDAVLLVVVLVVDTVLRVVGRGCRPRACSWFNGSLDQIERPTPKTEITPFSTSKWWPLYFVARPSSSCSSQRGEPNAPDGETKGAEMKAEL